MDLKPRVDCELGGTIKSLQGIEHLFRVFYWTRIVFLSVNQ
jgi:hypothetical protein